MRWPLTGSNDSRQSLVDVVAVGSGKIGYQLREVGTSQFVVVGQVIVEGIDVANEQEKVGSDAIFRTHFTHRAIAETKADTKTRKQQNDVIVGGHQIRHFHPLRKQLITHLYQK